MNHFVRNTRTVYETPISEDMAGRIMEFTLKLAMAMTAAILFPSALVLGIYLARALAWWIL